MGLISSLLTLPLAPVRGTMRVATMLEDRAATEAYDESSLREAMNELEAACEAGELSEAELEEAEDVLLERLIAVRGLSVEEASPDGG